MLDSNAIKSTLTTLLRHVISIASGGFVVWLAQHGINAGTEVAELVGVIAGVLVNVGFAVGVMLIRKWRLSLALNLDSSATHADLNALASTVPKLTQMTQALTPPTDMLPQEEPQNVSNLVGKR